MTEHDDVIPDTTSDAPPAAALTSAAEAQDPGPPRGSGRRNGANDDPRRAAGCPSRERPVRPGPEPGVLRVGRRGRSPGFVADHKDTRRQVPRHRRAPAPGGRTQGRAGRGPLRTGSGPARMTRRASTWTCCSPTATATAGTSPRSRKPPRCSPPHEAGATRTRLRKSTGRKAEEIKKTLQAGSLTTETRAAAGRAGQPADSRPARPARGIPGRPRRPAAGDDRDPARGPTANTPPSGSARTAPKPPRTSSSAPSWKPPGITVTDGLPEGAVHLAGLLHDRDGSHPRYSR